MADLNLYTLRWVINNKWGDMSYKDTANKLVSLEIGDWVDDGQNDDEEPERPSVSEAGAKLKYCPFADQDFPQSRTRGEYSDGYPKGAIVHFTAGRRNGLKNALTYQANQGYTYFVIDEDGNVGQNFPLNEWGYHAGKSHWPSLGSSVSKHLVGIEVQCAGKLNSSNRSWFGVTYPEEEVRTVSARDNMKSGKYLKYTDKQEESLTKLILWLKSNNPEVFNLDLVLGHDEVSPDRKNDPGGALSMTMPEYREFLKSGG